MSNSPFINLFREDLKVSLNMICQYRLRMSLIVLSVAVGVASVIGVVSIIYGLSEKIGQEVSASEREVLTVKKYDVLLEGSDRSIFGRREITPDDAEALRNKSESLQYVAFVVQTSGRIPYMLHHGSEKSRMIQIAGSEPSLFHIWNLELEDGRMFTAAEVRRGAKVIVLGPSPRRDLFPSSDPIDKQVKIGNDSFTVVGTIAERKTLFGDGGQNFALIPYTTFMRNLLQEGDPRVIYGEVRGGVALEAARDNVIQVIRSQRRLKFNQNNNFVVTTSEAAIEYLREIATPLARTLVAIASISLFVGGIGVMNMMLVSVTERTGEIGIRMAVGATRRVIRWQFLIEAGILTGMGGVLGIILGLALAAIVGFLTGLPASLSPSYAALAVAVSIAIGMICGMSAANKAAWLDPVKAMGYAK